MDGQANIHPASETTTRYGSFPLAFRQLSTNCKMGCLIVFFNNRTFQKNRPAKA